MTKTTDFSTQSFSVIVSDKYGNTTQGTPTEIIYYLVDRVTAGDYVAYNAGSWSDGDQSGTGWTSSTATPTTQASFGGYTAGTDKATSVQGTTNGWRVLTKSGEGSTGTVTLISAGSPAYAYKAGNNASNMNGLVTALNNFASANYLNTTYASSARNMNTGDWGNVYNGGMSNIGAQYWLSNAYQVSTYRVSGTSYYGYLFRYNSNTGTYNRYSRRSYYTSRSSNGTYYGVYAVNSDGNNYYYLSVNTTGAYTAYSPYTYYIYDSYSGSNPAGSYLYGFSSGSIYYSSSTSVGQYNAATYGTRPVVVLKAGIKTNVSKDQTYLDQTCWNLEI